MGQTASRKEFDRPRLWGVGEVTLVSDLMYALIVKQLYTEKGLTEGAKLFEDAIQSYRRELSKLGLDPDQLVQEKIDLLQKALQIERNNSR